MKKIGLFFGGMGNEAEVSVKSAANIASNIDQKKYRLVPIFWDKKGRFFLLKKVGDYRNTKKRKLLPIEKIKNLIDVAFPVTHGKYGEDGVLQALFEMQKIKYCGCRVAGSSVCMDKALFKDLVKGAGIRQTKYLVLDLEIASKSELEEVLKTVDRDFSYPIFVKPANSGSSVGVTRVRKFSELTEAIRVAEPHDKKIIFENGFSHHRELEVSILGNSQLIVSDPGELEVQDKFYDYDEKYKLNQTKIIIPARIAPRLKKEIKSIAERAYRLCSCRGYARVDFFVQDNRVYLNEINSLPGFTDISMYPMLLRQHGIAYKELIDRIIALAY